MFKTTSLAAIVATIAIAGCASFGDEFDPSLIDQLQPGVSTVDEAVALLGPYSRESVGANGVHAYVWSYSAANGFTGKSSAKVVSLAFGPDGKLLTKSRNSTEGKF